MVSTFYRVTIKQGKRTRKFWAKDRRRKGKMTLYTPVNAEGDEYARYKGKVLHLRKDLISNSLILKEQLAVLDKKYGTLKIKKSIGRR